MSIDVYRLVPLCVILFGCAANPDPIVDTRGVDMIKYEQDLADCKTFKEQVPTEVGVVEIL